MNFICKDLCCWVFYPYYCFLHSHQQQLIIIQTFRHHLWHRKCVLEQFPSISRQNFELNTCVFLCLLCVFKGCLSCNLHVPLMRAAVWWPKRLDYNQLLLVRVKKTIIWISLQLKFTLRASMNKETNKQDRWQIVIIAGSPSSHGSCLLKTPSAHIYKLLAETTQCQHTGMLFALNFSLT